MAGDIRINHETLAAEAAQQLIEPADAILGCQRLIVEDLVHQNCPEALEDAQRALEAAQSMCALVAMLVTGGAEEVEAATLRHDFRTPVNAILGYSELILEDSGRQIDANTRADIYRVIDECGKFLTSVDTLLDLSQTAEAQWVSDLDATIAESLEKALADPAAEPVVEAGRILIIDDIAENRDLLGRLLSARGHLVESLASAREGLARLEEAEFDVLLVDILMPDMNGIELLRRLKEEQRWRDMPVIMISGLKENRAVVRCIAAGAEDYLQKPIDPVLLRTRIEASLERVRWRAREKQFLARIRYERDRADTLLHAMLPAPVIRRLQGGETVIADRFDAATIVFADIVDFTPLVSRTDPPLLVRQLADIFSAFDDLADRHGIEKIKTIGDAYMAAAGIPAVCEDHAPRALAFARDLIATMRGDVGQGLAIRVGLHTGPVIAGLIGRMRFVYDVWGETVNMASRLEASGLPGRIHISEAALQALAGEVKRIAPRQLELKGLGRVRTFLID